MASTRVYVEVGAKRAFASAADWPGWSRSGRDEAAALEALAAYAPRYARVTKLAKIELPKDATSFKVVERLKGNATTDFGAPGIPAKDETRRMTPAETRRMVSLAGHHGEVKLYRLCKNQHDDRLVPGFSPRRFCIARADGRLANRGLASAND